MVVRIGAANERQQVQYKKRLYTQTHLNPTSSRSSRSPSTNSPSSAVVVGAYSASVVPRNSGYSNPQCEAALATVGTSLAIQVVVKQGTIAVMQTATKGTLRVLTWAS